MIQCNYTVCVIALLFCITCTTRALPFIFGKKMKENQLILFLGNRLPVSIIFLLCVYYIMSIAKPSLMILIPQQLIALVVTLLVQWKWRNMTISLFLGTVLYLALNHVWH
ncbi:MAG: AzlD domain-containing protein [Coxiellaceae bacterium]|nr:AzlD domain-containing protein [Coxiellaceae bacterium]